MASAEVRMIFTEVRMASAEVRMIFAEVRMTRAVDPRRRDGTSLRPECYSTSLQRRYAQPELNSPRPAGNYTQRRS